VIDATVQLFPYFDWGATVLWAMSGAMLGARRGFSFMGIFVVALVSATGGSLLRDGLLLQDGPPALLRTPIYLALVIGATIVVVLFGRHLRNSRWFEPAVAVVDALGLGAYAVVGMNMAIVADLPLLAAIVVGMVSAIGGSVLRDLLMGDTPDVLKPGVWLAGAALCGCILFAAFMVFKVDTNFAAAAAILFTFVIRMLALRYDLRTRPLNAFEDDWRNRTGGMG
jgi:uncharacterized membrane protein YeiH